MCYGCCLSAAIFIKGATMKEIFKIFVLLVMICTFTACAAGGKTSDTKDISIKLESFSDVKKDILSTDTEYENISVPTETLQALANDLPEKAELADLKQVNDREQCFGKIRPLFISDKDYKKEYYQGFDSSFPAGNVYDDTTYYLNVASNGGIGFLSKESAYDCETIKTVFVDRPYEDEEYVLGGQTYKLSQGVEYVDGFLQALTDSGFGNMKIAYVDVLKYDQENALLFHIQRTVDGIALNDFFYRDGDFDEYPYFGAKLYMTAPNTVGEFLGDHGFCELDGSAESVDKCVTLESALDICENTLAANHKYTVNKIDLGYMQNVVKANGEPWNKDSDGQFYFQGDTKYKTELGWFIWLDTTTDNERMVFVNALNGEALVLFNNADVSEN